MISQRKLLANRLNAQKSTGPKTPEGRAHSAQNAAKSTGPKTQGGKARSSLNGVKHGLRSSRFLIRPDEVSHLIEQERLLAEELRPADEVERSIVRAMAMALWMGHKATAEAIKAEKTMVLAGLDAEGGISHALWASRHEARYSRKFHSLMSLMLEMRNERTEAKQKK